MLTAVTGINWGDEGKGRVIDLLAENADVVVRYQGGNNAGHTVVAKQQKFVLNLLPSGILHENVICVLGDGMVVDLEHLTNEIAQIREKGVVVTPNNLKLSKRATISMPWHKIQDELEETRLAKTGAAFGSTKRGIAYAYSDKYRKKTLRLGDLLHLKEESVQNRLKMMLEAKNLELAGCYYQEPMSYPALLSWCEAQAAELWPYIVDTGAYLEEALKEGKRVVLEAQLGAMRDIDYGIFPYTSSSSTISAYGPIGAGIPGKQLDHVVGVLKAYSTCVGAGPFTAEKAMPESWMELLRKFGGEYGAATGRPRRVGPFDAVASRYGLKCQNADKIALTKLDVLSMMKEIPVIVGYKKGNQEVTDFDPIEDLEEYVPIVRMLPGWQTDISGCVTYDELPDAAKTYVETLEDLLQHEIQFISVGAERSQYLTRRVVMRHLISPLDFTVEEAYEVLDFADRIAANPKAYAHAADGRQLATLFYEPSTRTRLSFESAMLSLGGQTIGFAGADQSSVSKGETIADTVRVVSCYADIIVMRHPKEGAPLCASMYSKIPVINAGDGGHNHPTQTLIDLMTIRQRLGRLDNLTIGFCGDLKFGRTVHSLVKSLVRHTGNKFYFISPEELRIPDYLVDETLEPTHTPYEEVSSLEDSLPKLDVLYMTRVQKERFFNEEDYIRLKDTYILNREKLQLAKEDMPVLHPLPRVDEIAYDVDDDSRAAYFQQVQNGKYMRMALILSLLGIEDPQTGEKILELGES